MTSAVIQGAIDSGLLRRLPVTFAAYFQDQLNSWEMLFPAERSYYERLVQLLNGLETARAGALFQPLREVETRMNLRPDLWAKGEFTLDHVDFLNRSPVYPEWRRAVAAVFSHIDPVLDAEVARAGKPRLVIILTPSEIALPPERMWTRIASRGKRIRLEPPEQLTSYVRFAAGLLSAYGGAHGPYTSWAVEAGADLAPLIDSPAVCLSYVALQTYRTRLMSEVNRIVQSEQIRGPRQLGSRLRALHVNPSESAIGRDALLSEFTRAVLLNGNGTLLVNNTFVEWATVQAVRRARPSVVVSSFGIRNKMKPFSSLLIYADQDKSNPIPSQMDVLGTSVDLEIFYQYIWQEFEKYPEYKRNTACLFLAQGADELLCIAPADFPLLAHKGTATLPTLMEHSTSWLGL
jgi:hypothetical protein